MDSSDDEMGATVNPAEGARGTRNILSSWDARGKRSRL